MPNYLPWLLNPSIKSKNRREQARGRIEWLGMVAASRGSFDKALFQELCNAADHAVDERATEADIGTFWDKYWEFSKRAGVKSFRLRIASLADSLKACLGFNSDTADPLDFQRCLQISADEVHWSMRYAAQSGLAIDKSVSEALLTASERIRTNAPDTQGIAAFWEAYEKFNKALDPATISSAAKTLRVRESPFVGPFLVIGGITLAVFVWTGVMLMDYTEGVTIRTNLQTSRKELADADAALQKANANSVKLASIGTANVSAPPSVADAATAVSLPADADATAKMAGPVPVTRTAACSARQTLARRVDNELHTLLRWTVRNNSTVATDALAPISIETNECGPGLEMFSNTDIAIFNAELTLDRFTKLLLPTALGLLGAAIFMLRSAINQVRDGTYTAVFYSLALVRLCLGSFAGLSTVLLFSPDSFSQALNLRGLTASGIAFVAGYSIDILFALLDKFVAAFSGKTST